MKRASRLCSWIVKIADLYVVFIAAYSRGRYEREIQALPGTAASSRDSFFFFSKSRVHGLSVRTDERFPC